MWYMKNKSKCRFSMKAGAFWDLGLLHKSCGLSWSQCSGAEYLPQALGLIPQHCRKNKKAKWSDMDFLKAGDTCMYNVGL